MSEHDPIYRLPPFTVHKGVFPMSPTLWHYPRSVFEDIWSNVDTSGVRIAILDTGVNPHHDLPKPIAARSFIRGQGWNDPQSGHGTHCAGTALGRRGIGFSREAELIVGKVLSNGGSGASSGIAAGIRWAAEEGADVISMSLGGGSPYQPTLDAIEYAIELGAVVVAAAGNAGYRGSNTIGYPARFAPCLAIAATQQSGAIANFSSGGPQIDFACPGQNIISCGHRGGYVSMSGTSMATPYAAGMCGSIIAKMRSEGEARLRGADAWRAFVRKHAEDRGSRGKDARFGDGVPRVSDMFAFLAGKGEFA